MAFLSFDGAQGFLVGFQGVEQSFGLAERFEQFGRQIAFVAIFIGGLVALLIAGLVIGIVRVAFAVVGILAVALLAVVWILFRFFAFALIVFGRGGFHSNPLSAIKYLSPSVSVGFLVGPAFRFVVPFAAGEPAYNTGRMAGSSGKQRVAVGEILTVAGLLCQHPANDRIVLFILGNACLACVLMMRVEPGDDLFVQLGQRQFLVAGDFL